MNRLRHSSAGHTALLRHIEANRHTARRVRGENLRGGMRIAYYVPFACFPVCSPRVVASAHDYHLLEQRRDFRVERKKRRDISQRANRQQRDLMRQGADRVAQELYRGIALLKFGVRPVFVERFGLRGAGLLRGNQQRRFHSHMDRNIGSVCGAAHGVRKAGPLFRFARHRRNAEQVTTRLTQQISERYRIINIGANVGIQNNRCFFHFSSLSLWQTEP